MIDTKKVEEAIAEIDKITVIHEQTLWEIKGDLFLKIGKEKEAFEYYEKTRGLKSGYGYKYYFEREQYDEAWKYCERYHCAEQEDFINALINAGKYKTALDYLKTWKWELKRPFCIYKKGFCLQKLGKWKKALVCYDHALRHGLFGEYGLYTERQFLYQKGLCLLHLGKFEESRDTIAKLENFFIRWI
jgi:tetratricopeptide (TPR) repeat protein